MMLVNGSRSLVGFTIPCNEHQHSCLENESRVWPLRRDGCIELSVCGQMGSLSLEAKPFLYSGCSRILSRDGSSESLSALGPNLKEVRVLKNILSHIPIVGHYTVVADEMSP